MKNSILTLMLSIFFLLTILSLNVNIVSGLTSITNCTDLQDMQNNLTEDYQLLNNINCSDTINWNTGAGFIPVGNNANKFTGTFDGEDYNITGLFINRSILGYPNGDFQGLFGATTSNSIIQNVGLINAYVEGHELVGGLVGYAEEILINNSFVIGTILGTASMIGGMAGVLSSGIVESSYAIASVSGEQSIGGLIGYAEESIINNSYSTGNTNASLGIANGDVGGLVGTAYTGEISNSYATGNVYSLYNDVGGLVGHLSGNVINCYATGDVNGVNNIGGLVGRIIYDEFTPNVINSYSIGNVVGESSVGGLVGYNEGNCTNSYWDIETSGQNTSACGTEKTTDQMVQQATFIGWDFVNVWDITENVTYPYLFFESEGYSPFPEPEEPEEEPAYLSDPLYQTLASAGAGVGIFANNIAIPLANFLLVEFLIIIIVAIVFISIAHSLKHYIVHISS